MPVALAPPERAGPTTQIVELKDLVVAYAKQETVDPLRTLGSYLGLGIAGAVCIGTGLVFALLALLRGLQELTVFNDVADPEGGRWSWAPYFITTVVGVVVVALFLRTLYKLFQPPSPTASRGPTT
jgi:hypothetical protein